MPTIAIADIPYAENLRVAEIVQGGIPARALKKFADALSRILVQPVGVAAAMA